MNPFHSFKALISFPIPLRFMVCLLKILQFEYTAEKRWGSIYIYYLIYTAYTLPQKLRFHSVESSPVWFLCMQMVVREIRMNRYEGRGLWTTAFPSLFTVLDVETDFKCLKCPFSNLFWPNSAEENTSSSSAVDIFMNFSDPTSTYQSRDIQNRDPEPSWVCAAGWSDHHESFELLIWIPWPCCIQNHYLMKH